MINGFGQVSQRFDTFWISQIVDKESHFARFENSAARAVHHVVGVDLNDLHAKPIINILSPLSFDYFFES